MRRAVPELPALEPGVQLLATDEASGVEPLQTLVVDHVLRHRGPAYWVDPGRHAVTASLRRLAPSDRVLDRVRIARGFTAYQHTALLRRLRERVRERSPSVVVAPAFDERYREDVQGDTGRRMLVSALADLARMARGTGVPVLLTRQTADAFSAPVAELATGVLEYEETPHGPRFAGAEFETLVYPLRDGWVQTTVSFWTEVLAAREPLYDAAPAASSAG